MTVGYSDPNLSVGPHHDPEHIPALRRWVGRELSPRAALAMVHLLPPAALSSGTLLSGSLDVPCSGWVCFQTATTVSGLEFSPFPGHSLGGHSDISRAGLLHLEGPPRSHVYQDIQWNQASLLPTEDSDEAVLFFLRSHTDLGAREREERLQFSENKRGPAAEAAAD